MKVIVLSFVLSLFITPAYAFTWSKCETTLDNFKGKHKLSLNPSDIIGWITTDATSHTTTSTTSFVTSTGGCAAFAKADEQRETFIAESMKELKIEAAEGRGEHIESLAALYGCKKEVRSQFAEMMKSHHSEIFSEANEEQFQEVNARIFKGLESSDTLVNNCSPDIT